MSWSNREIHRSIKLILVIFSTLIITYILCISTFKVFNSCFTKSYVRPSDRLIAIYQKQAASRRHYLSMVRPNITDSPQIATIWAWGFLYNNLAPEAFCAEKVKVGKTDDGGKWMCSPMNLPPNCTILSLGINEEISFEKDLHQLSGGICRTISIDYNGQSNETKDILRSMNGEVIKAMIETTETPIAISLETILKKSGVEKVEILKMDIEKTELRVLEPFLNKYQVSQIIVEVHADPYKTVNLLKSIASRGYLLHNYEINGRTHTLCEYSFIHFSVLERYEATYLARYL